MSLAAIEPSERPSLLGASFEELVDRLGGPARSRCVFALLRAGKDPSTALPRKARERLLAAFDLEDLALDHLTSAQVSDGTIKVWIPLLDGGGVETVVIPSQRRTTLCLSSQVGCARACVFCRTGGMGLIRNLNVSELLRQVFAGIVIQQRAMFPPLTNIVWMGMGEPLDNLPCVERACEILIDDRAFGFGAGRMTLSTVGGSSAHIERACALPCRVAWSLHAADDDLRVQLIPSMRHSVREQMEAFSRGLSGRNARALFVEVTLIQGVNDSEPHASALLEAFSRFPHEVRFNLLPMNPIGTGHAAPDGGQVERFASTLREGGRFTKVRESRGQDVLAACGQLAIAHVRAAACQ